MPGSPHRAARAVPLRTVLMLALTFSTGVVDAVGFLSLEHTFAANMTGNLVLVGLGAIGAIDTDLRGPVGAVLAFVAGAALGAALARRGDPEPRASAYRGLHLTAVVLAAVAVGEALRPPDAAWAHVAAVAALGFAMGAQAALARRVGVADVNTLVVTLPLAAFGSRLAGAAAPGQVRRAASVGLLALGAVVGGLLSFSAPWAGIALAAAVTTAVALVGAWRDAS